MLIGISTSNGIIRAASPKLIGETKLGALKEIEWGVIPSKAR